VSDPAAEDPADDDDASTDAADDDDSAPLPPIPRAWGTWVWDESEFGAGALAEDDAVFERELAAMVGAGIGRAYISWSSRSVDDPTLIASRNAALRASGIEPSLLLSDNDWILRSFRGELLSAVEQRVLAFHAGLDDPAGRFAAVHLDLEPHGRADWSDGSVRQRELLAELKTTFEAVGELLAADPDVALEADLAVWFDALPPPNGSSTVGWASAADRDGWFQAVAAVLDQPTMMAYERDSAQSAWNAVSFEAERMPVRVALEAWLGADGTWADLPELLDAAEALEDLAGRDAVDLHSWRRLREAGLGAD